MLWNSFFRDFEEFYRKGEFGVLDKQTSDGFCHYLNTYFNTDYPDPSVVLTAEYILKALTASAARSSVQNTVIAAKDQNWARNRTAELLAFAQHTAWAYSDSVTRNSMQNDIEYFAKLTEHLASNPEDIPQKQQIITSLKQLTKGLDDNLRAASLKVFDALYEQCMLYGLEPKYNDQNAVVVEDTYDHNLEKIKQLDQQTQQNIVSLFKIYNSLYHTNEEVLRCTDSIEHLDFLTLTKIGQSLASTRDSMVTHLMASLGKVEPELTTEEICAQLVNHDIDLINLEFDLETWNKQIHAIDPSNPDNVTAYNEEMVSNFSLLLPFMRQHQIQDLSDIKNYQVLLEQYLKSYQSAPAVTTLKGLQDLSNKYGSNEALKGIMAATVYIALLYNIDKDEDSEKLEHVHIVFGVPKNQIVTISNFILKEIDYKLEGLGKISKRDLARLTVAEREQFINDNKNTHSQTASSACVTAANFNNFIRRQLKTDLRQLSEDALNRKLAENADLLLQLEQTFPTNYYEISLKAEYAARLQQELRAKSVANEPSKDINSSPILNAPPMATDKQPRSPP